MMPRMIVVGGPPGAGESTLLPVRSFGVDAFNIDDRCSELHGGYVGIPKTVRAAAAGECERFIVEHIHCRRSFAVETTMRTAVAIEQARLAREYGFTTLLWFFVCGRSHDSCAPSCGEGNQWRSCRTGSRNSRDVRSKFAPSCGCMSCI